jgi:hypothetical protein
MQTLDPLEHGGPFPMGATVRLVVTKHASQARRPAIRALHFTPVSFEIGPRGGAFYTGVVRGYTRHRAHPRYGTAKWYVSVLQPLVAGWLTHYPRVRWRNRGPEVTVGNLQLARH